MQKSRGQTPSCPDAESGDYIKGRGLQDGALPAPGLRGGSRIKNRAATLDPGDWTDKEGAYRIASSNTLFRFRCVSAEHSRYLCARISLATVRACSYVTGSIFRRRRVSVVARSSRRSSLVPTRMMGTFGAWCSISGYHCMYCQPVCRLEESPVEQARGRTLALTLSKEGGLTMEKQMRKTSVCG